MQLTIRVIALPDSEAAIWQFSSPALVGKARIKALVCEIAQPKLSRNADIGADKPGVLEPKGEVLQTAEVALDDAKSDRSVYNEIHLILRTKTLPGDRPCFTFSRSSRRFCLPTRS